MQVKAIPITCFILISLWFYKLEINENRGCIILTRERISPILFSLLPHLAAHRLYTSSEERAGLWARKQK